MVKLLFLLLGGAIGTVCRYGLITGIERSVVHSFPLGILSVNVLGSFLIGVLWSFAEAFHFPVNIRIFLFTGLLGGFTTFSSFALDTMVLMKAGEYKFAFLNMLANNLFGFTAVFLGFILAKNILTLMK